MFVTYAWSIVAALTGLARLAAGVAVGHWMYHDSHRQTDRFAVTPRWWGVIGFISPVIGILVYWLIHYSRLSKTGKKTNPRDNAEPSAAPLPSEGAPSEVR